MTTEQYMTDSDTPRTDNTDDNMMIALIPGLVITHAALYMDVHMDYTLISPTNVLSAD